MATATTTRRPSGPVLSAAHYRYASPTRVSLSGARAAGQSVSVSSSSSASPSRGRRTCMCSPTSHPGSFRCSLHKERARPPPPPPHGHGKPSSPPAPPLTTTSRLGGAGRRMGSALVRIGAVEGGQCARRALAATTAQHRRRVGVGAARPRPSRLSAVSVAGDRPGDNGHL